MASEDGGFYALLRHDRGNPLPLGPGAALLSGGWEISLVLLPLVFLLFPDGRLSSRGWRWALRAYLVVSGAYLGVLTEVAIAAIVGHPLRLTSIGGLAAVDDPSGLLAASERAFLPLYLAFFLSFALRQVLSWRRSGGERRQQLKWLMIGAALCELAVLVNVAGPALAPNAPPAVSAASSALGILFAGLPVCMGVAILRYRRDRPDHLPHAGVRDRDRAAGRRLRRFGDPCHPGAGALLAGGGGPRHARCHGSVRPAAAAGAADRGPRLQPCPLRRRPDGGSVRRPAAGRRGPRHGSP